MSITKPRKSGAAASDFILSILLGLTLLIACKPENEVIPDDNEEPPLEDSALFQQPINFPKATYTFNNNPITEEAVQLGRMLFYDPILSTDSTVSCSTCHRQQTGFADPTHRINHGVNNLFGKRNSPAIANMAFSDFFFLDGGVGHLDFVPINAITSPVEMGSTLQEVVTKLNRHFDYKQRFFEAFKKDSIDSQQLLYALSQFTVMLVSANSKYDQVQRGEAIFSEAELRGHNLFVNKCAPCHATDLFTDNYFHNNGLDDFFARDRGRAIITELEEDLGKFKVPSLRNIEVTPPYMHDGRLANLEQVLTHYVSRVQDSPSLDPILKQNGTLGIDLSDQGKADIILFLKTLTDQEFLKDPRFSDPFRE